MRHTGRHSPRQSRRTFLHDGSLLLLSTGFAANSNLLLADTSLHPVRIGMVTDLHYADKPAAGTRYYRETLSKMEEVAVEFQKAKPAFTVELGDLIDSADSVEVEKEHLARINKVLSTLPGDKHYVLGNHCVSALTKDEFLDGIGRVKSYYSFDVGGFHFVVLDACFRSDGQSYGRNNFKWTDANIPTDQIEWLQHDLKKTTSKTIVFVHQRLDVGHPYGIKNAAQIRDILEESGKVLAVFQGHSHKNDLIDINGIHYCTLVAMVEGSGAESNAFSLMDIFDDGAIRLTGFRNQRDYQWKA